MRVISSFLSNRELQLVLNGNYLQEYQVNTEVYMMNIWQQLELTSEFESDIQDTVD